MISPLLSPWWPPVPLDGQDPVALVALRARTRPPAADTVAVDADPAVPSAPAELADGDETREAAKRGTAAAR